MRSLNYVVFAIMFCIAGISNAQTKASFGKGISYKAPDESFSIKFNTRVQSLFIVDFPDINDTENQDPTAQMLIRRARLKFGGFAFNPDVTYKVELGLSNRDIGGASSHTKDGSKIILDAVVKWKFSKHWSVWFGQTKLPGNRERVISSQNLQFVDRSLLNSVYNIDRDMGFQLRGKYKFGDMIVKEALSVSMGEGRNVTDKNQGGFDYTGRVEVLPFGAFAGKGDYFASDLKREQSPKLALGVSYDYHHNAVKTKGNLGSWIEDGEGGYAQATLKTLFVDMMFKYKGWSVMGEYADKASEDGAVVTNRFDEILGTFQLGTGLNLQAGYLFKNNIELAGRMTNITPEEEVGAERTQYTFGVSRYFSGHNLKIQSDISYMEIVDSDVNPVTFRFQVELGL